MRLRVGDAEGKAPTKPPPFVKGRHGFSHIMRFLNTNLDGKHSVMYTLTAIKGIGRRFSEVISKVPPRAPALSCPKLCFVVSAPPATRGRGGRSAAAAGLHGLSLAGPAKAASASPAGARRRRHGGHAGAITAPA